MSYKTSYVVLGVVVIVIGLLLGVPNLLFPCVGDVTEAQALGQQYCGTSHAYGITGVLIVATGIVAILLGRDSNGPALGAPGGSRSELEACKACGRVYPEGAYAFCPSCGQKLSGS